jgi:hypothetical protein
MDFRSLRPGFPVHPPVVARHLAFHLNTEDNPNRAPDDGVRADKWKVLCGRLEDHLNALRTAHAPADGVQFIGPDEPPCDTPLCFSLRGSCLVPINAGSAGDDYRLRVRVDVHVELITLTYIFDEIGWRSNGPLGDRFARLFDTARPDEAKRAIDWLFDGMWRSPELRCAREIKAWPEWDDPVTGRRLVTRITDFRGVVICPEPNWPFDRPSLDDQAIRTEEDRERDRRLDDALVAFAHDNSVLIRSIADIHPEIESTAGGEAVICGMLRGKALYAAALGQWGEGVERIQPIRHLLVYSGHSHAQLGRLLRRMHILGELRHAALIDYDPDPESERQGGSAPASLRKGLRDASRAIAALSGDLTSRTGEITISRAPIEQLKEYVAELASISQMVDGGLTYRVEQSRFYAHEFKQTIKHLRLIRIGDWQAYDDFVERYVMHLFARIDRIGNRYEALGRRLDRLLFFAQAKLLDSYTKNVDTTVQQIEEMTRTLAANSGAQAETLCAIRDAATRQIGSLENIDLATGVMNRSANQQIAASRKQIELLAVAELFATVFLFYYVGSVVDHLFEAGHGGQLAFRWAWAGLISLLGTWLLFRIVTPKRYRRFSRHLRLLLLPARYRRLGLRIRRLRKTAHRLARHRPLPAAGRTKLPLAPDETGAA